MKIRRRFDHWIPRLLKINAIVLYPFILFAEPLKAVRNKRNMYKHEWIHVEQYRREGILKFIITYLWEQFYKGYMYNKYELEAGSNQHKDFTSEEMNAWREDMNQ